MGKPAFWKSFPRVRGGHPVPRSCGSQPRSGPADAQTDLCQRRWAVRWTVRRASHLRCTRLSTGRCDSALRAGSSHWSKLTAASRRRSWSVLAARPSTSMVAGTITTHIVNTRTISSEDNLVPPRCRKLSAPQDETFRPPQTTWRKMRDAPPLVSGCTPPIGTSPCARNRCSDDGHGAPHAGVRVERTGAMASRSAGIPRIGSLSRGSTGPRGIRAR